MVVGITFAIAAMLGGVMSRTNFCTMGGVADIVNMGDWVRMRMWLLAIGVAIIGTQALAASGMIDLGQSFYTAAAFPLVSYLLGGLLFGFGMVLASGCGSKTLIRIGGGSLKAVVVFLALGLAAYMTMRGIFSVPRVMWIDSLHTDLGAGQDLPRLLAGGPAAAWLHLMAGLVIGGALIAFAFADREFRRLDPILGGVATGLAIVGLWFVTGYVGHIDEDPRTLEAAYLATDSGRPESFTFVAPVAYTLELLLFWSDASRIVSIGIAAVLGMIAGSFAYALSTRQFRLEGFASTEDTANHLAGGTLMGIGGVTALGCTVGQGLSGMSTLALGSLVALVSIIAGAWLGLRYQVWRIDRMD